MTEETSVLVLHAAAVADSEGAVVPCAGLATLAVQVFGTVTTATITFQGTVDGYTWTTILGWNRATGVKASTATAAGQWVFDVTGLTGFRANLDWTAGSVDVVAKGSSIPTTTLVTAS
jgi:hypothetical protein